MKWHVYHTKALFLIRGKNGVFWVLRRLLHFAVMMMLLLLTVYSSV